MTISAEPQLDVKTIAQHWMMRCVENGVPLQDYLDITKSVSSWDEWCDAWAANADERARQAADAESAGDLLTAGELRVVAALEYHFGKFVFLHEPDTMRAVHSKAVDCYRRALPDVQWPGHRFEIPFAGSALPAVLRVPAAPAAAPHPTVVVVPGLDATKEELHRFQEVFLARGLATVSLDGPGQGECEYDMTLPADWEVVGAAVLDGLSERPEVDDQRLAMVGVSLGGYFAARTAAVETRLRATVVMGGCYSVGECWDDLSFLTRQAFRFRSGASDMDEARRIAGTFTLSDLPSEADAPVLVVHGAQDRLFGPEQADRLTQHFGNRGQLVMEPRGNHVLHNLAYRVRPLVADWVAAQLLAAEPARAAQLAAAGER